MKPKKKWFDSPGRCPACGQIFLKATGLTQPGTKPRTGDVTICTQCGEILLFDVELAVRRPTVLEMIEIQEAPQWATVERASRIIRVHKPFH
jgi:hypothetical protein